MLLSLISYADEKAICYEEAEIIKKQVEEVFTSSSEIKNYSFEQSPATFGPGQTSSIYEPYIHYTYQGTINVDSNIKSFELSFGFDSNTCKILPIKRFSPHLVFLE